MNDVIKIYQDKNTFRLWEAALLILVINPSGYTLEKLLKNPPLGFNALLDEMLEDATIILNEGVESQEFPDEFYTEYVLHTESSIDLQRGRISEQDKPLIQVNRSAIVKWAIYRRRPASFFTDDDNIDISPLEKPLIPKERNSLHTIIGAMLQTLLENGESGPFPSQASLIEYLCKDYGEYDGVSKSNLEKVFPIAKKLIDHPK